MEGQLERMKIVYQSRAEESRKALLELENESLSIITEGKAVAEAQSKTESQLINARANVEFSKSQVESIKTKKEGEIIRQEMLNNISMEFKQRMSEINVKTTEELSKIEANKFKAIVECLGTETLLSISRSGVENQVKLLEGLGLKGFLLTDGKSPINLFDAANGLIGGKKD